MRLTFSPSAAEDLEEIGDYIARDNPKRALAFLENLESHCKRILEIAERIHCGGTSRWYTNGNPQ